MLASENRRRGAKTRQEVSETGAKERRQLWKRLLVIEERVEELEGALEEPERDRQLRGAKLKVQKNKRISGCWRR